MSNKEEKEPRFLLWAVLGSIILGLTATIYVASDDNDAVPSGLPNSNASTPPSTLNNANGLSTHVTSPPEKIQAPPQKNDPRKNWFADPPPGHAYPLTGPGGLEFKAANIDGGYSVMPADPRTRVSIDAGKIGDSYSSVIAIVVQSKISGIKYCFDKEFQKQPNLAGRIVANWTIGSDGQVIEYKIASSTVANPEVGSCTLRMIRRWRFPEPPNGQVNVSFPFTFTTRK